MLVQGPILQGEESTVPVESHHTPSDKAASIRVDVRLGGAVVTLIRPHPCPMIHLSYAIDLQESKKVYSTAFTKLIMKVKNLEKRVKSNKARRRAKFIVSDDEEDLEDSSKQGRRIANIDQDFDIYLVHHDTDIQGRYEDISTAEFNISTAKPASTASAAVTTASVSTAEPSAPLTTTIKTYIRTTRGVTIREPSTRQRLSPQQ
ncbi:hypothetical protein Tco_0845393 [Tanacetum coccineum]